MEQFKDLHKQSEQLKNSGFNTGEIRKDITNMEEEKEQLLKRIERLRRKVRAKKKNNFFKKIFSVQTIKLGRLIFWDNFKV